MDRATLRTIETPRGVELKTDSLGRFRVCGVSTDVFVAMRASLDSYREVQLQLSVMEAEGVRRQNIALARGARARDSTAASASVTSSAHRALGDGTASVRGIVFGGAGPLPRAQVQRAGDSTATTTDSLGRYQLAGLSIDTQVLDVRRLGYLPRQLTLVVRPGENSVPDLYLTSVATLDTTRVFGRSNRYPEFERRARNSSFGRFLRAEDIARKKPATHQ